MDECDDRRSLNREDETDLNMETKNGVGANGSVSGEVTDNVVDIPGENSSSAGNLNTATGDENTASKPNNSTDEARSTVYAESYASRAARTAGTASNERPTWWRPSNYTGNDMPKRPRTALFTPLRPTSARTVFDALGMANINESDIQCMQRKMNGEVVITFKSSAVKEKFLNLNAITVGS